MRKFTQFILIFPILLLNIIPFSVKTSAVELERYGYSLLSNDLQYTTYNKLLECIENLDSSVNFTTVGITQENVNDKLAEVKFAAEMVRRDYPEFFWFDGEVHIGILDDVVTLTPSTYTVDGKVVTAGSSELKKAQNTFKTATNKALAKLNPNMSDYEIAHTIHDYLIDNVKYELSGDHQSAYGALVSGKGVCAGYTRAFQYLMNAVGIRCWYVKGTSYLDGKVFGHAWNLVWLDDMCYYTDVTWDDQRGELFHEYMNLCKEEISATHFTDDLLPENCGHDTYTFFVRNDGKAVCDFHGIKNDKQIADCFELREQEGGIATYYCTIHYHGNNFNEWFKQHQVGIITELGLSGAVSCKIIELGLEHHVTFTGKVSQNAETPPTQPQTEPAQTEKPTEAPTDAPTEKPTEAPTVAPTERPTEAPTMAPTQAPTETPTEAPTEVPTEAPTEPHTEAVTHQPTEVPTESAQTQPADTEVETEPETQTPADSQEDNSGGSPVTTLAFVGGGVATAGAGAGGYYWLLRRKKF